VAHISGFQLSEVGAIELFALSLLPIANFCMARIPGHYQMKEDAPVDSLMDILPSDYKVR
jgi:hypothetical protein